ncbi:hypothetical protein [Flavobacterium foetidum]|uniref:hypothetical protein n=1 Tax=Flavobacterium foetidum TaxID=2026681 RepID=UPI001074CEB7|nr:hypothetical protein [Flavobacterium foetidum]KAF2508287.1 hypothetical protein E0W73_19765 [Flavobacterium foetidum]
MEIQERYNIEETLNTFSFCPKKPSLYLLWWFLSGIAVGVIVLLFFDHHLEESMRWAIYIVLFYLAVQSLYDSIVSSRIRYTFNGNENAVYKFSPIFGKRKIMKLHEVVIFAHSEMGNWYYALGAARSQFVKNYILSESFSSGKKSLGRQDAYERFILKKIDKLVESVQTQA